MGMKFDFEEELKKLPAVPGVYLMHGQKDEVIYVGKAIVLKNRVRSYFDKNYKKTAKIMKMVSQVTRFEYIVTDSEWEALVLECNLIKEYNPKYNTMLKDGKTYPYICVSLSEEYPRIYQTRQRKTGKSRDRLFGPYTSGLSVKNSLELIHKLYKVRTCSKALHEEDIACGKCDRPCLNYHMKLCDAPCAGNISREEYNKNIEAALSFLSGRHKAVVKELEAAMNEASEQMNFEEAIRLRDLICSIRYIAGEQKITDENSVNRDVIAVAFDEEFAIAVVFFIRDGKMIGRDKYHLSVAKGDTEEKIVTSFMKQFYANTPFIPSEIFLPTGLDEDEDEKTIEKWLTKLKESESMHSDYADSVGGSRSAVHLVVPQKGKKERLVDLARENAWMVFRQEKEKMLQEEARTKGALKRLCRLIGIDENSRRIEAFDISNISGVLSVGSMIVFEDGIPKTRDYRKFRIKSVNGPDDYASMYEVLTRRMTHDRRQEENEDSPGASIGRFPDLILMDGGKGQVNIALQVLKEQGLDIPVCGMVKDDRHRTRGLYFNDEEVSLAGERDVFDLITRVQDEAHRFAIEYHRSLRSKESIHSILDDIPGIGPKRRTALMAQFGDIDNIRNASVEELASADGMNENAAHSVYDYFHQ